MFIFIFHCMDKKLLQNLVALLMVASLLKQKRDRKLIRMSKVNPLLNEHPRQLYTGLHLKHML